MKTRAVRLPPRLRPARKPPDCDSAHWATADTGRALNGQGATRWAEARITAVIKGQSDHSVRLASLIRVPVFLLPPQDNARTDRQVLEGQVPANALVDCGAQISIVTPRMVQKLGMENRVEPLPKGFRLATFTGEMANGIRAAGTVRLRLRCGDKDTNHRFVISKSHDQVIIGLDLFPRLGMFIGNIPHEPPGGRAGRYAAKVAAEAEEQLHQHRKVWGLEDRVPEREVTFIETAVRKELEANRRIDPKQVACESIPESTLRLPTPEGFSSYRRQYRVADAALPAIDEAIQLWKARGYVETGDPRAEFHTAVMAAPKKDLSGEKTGWRICMDFRHVNAGLNWKGFDNGRMPVLTEVFRRIKGFTHASALDLTSAYQQMRILEEHRHKTTFTWKGQRLQWARWPFGLTPCTVQFQKTMEIVLQGLEAHVVIWVDDILVFTKGSAEQHAAVLGEVLRRLNRHNLRLNVQKCHIGFKKVLLLGHYLTGDQRAVDPLKASQALRWPAPTTGKEVASFLGFANYVRDYIPLYAEMAAPLEALRKKKGRFILDKNEKRSFDSLVLAINTSPVLAEPDPELPYQVSTDASQTGMGCVLYQQAEDNDGNATGPRRYIAFASKALNGAQRSYPATKREILAIVFALNVFHEYLYGNKFVLYTDHAALTALFSKRELTYVMQNWLDVLLRYTFTPRHRPGVDMILPDKLSRMFADQGDPTGQRQTMAAMAVQDSAMLANLQLERTENEADVRPMRRSTDPDTDGDAEVLIGLELEEMVKFPERQLAEFVRERLGKRTCVDPEKQKEMLRTEHSKGHFGAERLFKAMWNQGWFWPGMRKQCQTVCGRCRPCLQYNIGREGFHPVKSLRADAPWDHVAIDCAVGLPESANGFKNILIIVDVATRYVVVKPLKSMEMEELARALYEVFATFGPPKAMQSDNGTEFINQVVEKLTRAAGVDHRTVAPYNPRANGLAERTVQTVKAVLKKKLAGTLDRWDQALAGATFAINATDSAATKTSPFLLFFGRSPNAWEDYTAAELQLQFGPADVEKLTQLQRTMREVIAPTVRDAAYQRQNKVNEQLNAKRKVVPTEYPPGALVMVRDPMPKGLEPRWVGPYLVVRRSKRGQTYTLRDQTDKVLPRTFPVSQLKFVADTRVPLTTADGEEVQVADSRDVVDTILEHRARDDGTTEYRVRWKGGKDQDATWITGDAFDDPATLTRYFKRARPGRRKRRQRT